MAEDESLFSSVCASLRYAIIAAESMTCNKEGGKGRDRLKECIGILLE